MKRKALLFLLCCSVLTSTSIFAYAQAPTLKDTAKSKFKVGQMWSYKTRPGEGNSYFIVTKVETHQKLGIIVHIGVQKLKMKNPQSPDGLSENVGHMPFAEAALSKSTLKILKKKVDLPDFEDGYQTWRKGFDAGRAGVFTVTLAEAVKFMEAILNQ